MGNPEISNCWLNSQLSYTSNQQQKSEINFPMDVVSSAQIAFKKLIFPTNAHAQWCSLRDTQVYAVYPLGKDKDLRIPT